MVCHDVAGRWEHFRLKLFQTRRDIAVLIQISMEVKRVAPQHMTLVIWCMVPL